MAKLFNCIVGPRLYRVYGPREGAAAPGAGGGREEPSWDSYYQPLGLEKHTDSVLALASVLWSVFYYASPLGVFYMYRKGLLTLPRVQSFSQYVAVAMGLLAGVACLRGLGRWRNPQYVEFITVLEDSHRLGTPEVKRKLAHYSFDFRSWPVDFRWDADGPSGAGAQKFSRLRGLWGLLVASWKWPRGGWQNVPLLRKPPRPGRGLWGRLVALGNLPWQLASLLLAHTLGRRILFPGSVRLLQKALLPVLLQGQARLVEEYGGRRAKLLACDGNEIDTIFVDRRRGGNPNGDTLVICCEGNAGFYEVGCVSTPLEAGYSVLGWNHPGFAGSTGVPLPQSEANAMDVVMRYVLRALRFPLPRVVIYAWSIGGFTATWAAMAYPEVGALVLDASFDDLVPLALKVLPQSWEKLVTLTVRQHLNLNNAEQLCSYQGPVLLVRRTRDEIITTTVPDDVASNRGNDLLLKLLQHRYPRVMEEGTGVVRDWLKAPSPAHQGGRGDWCLAALLDFAGDRAPPFPWSSFGENMAPEERREMALFLAQKHLQNFEATHCTPLPPQEFRLPWAL